MENKKEELAKKRMTFDTFKEMALDKALSKYEKIGFPDDYRQEYEKEIFDNIYDVLKLERKNIVFFDIGCGCSELPNLIIENSIKFNQSLYLIDSSEMLCNLKEHKNIIKVAAKFPDELELEKYKNTVDAIVIYSVLQHVILDMNPFTFIDKAVSLLKVGGRLLLGDIPNISKRNRFFASDTGYKFHQEFTKDNTKPSYLFNNLIEDKIDDSLVFAILNRYRMAGYETYLLEQPSTLPMYNRREDILIVKN